MRQYGQELLEILFAQAPLAGSRQQPPGRPRDAEPELVERCNVELELASAGGEDADNDRTARYAIDPEMANPRRSEHSGGRQSAAYYWTWRLLAAGFTPDECAAIRSLSAEVVLDHALRAADAGLQVDASWFLSRELIGQIDQVIGPGSPSANSSAFGAIAAGNALRGSAIGAQNAARRAGRTP